MQCSSPRATCKPGLTSCRTGKLPRPAASIAVVTRDVKNVHKAVKWHRVWYGLPGVDVPEIETRPNAMSWFDIEDPDGNEMRWYQVLTSDTQVTGERQPP
jgi:hypothetical protein